MFKKLREIFQFLMVRLKDFLFICFHFFCYLFQFLMVRLKAWMAVYITVYIPVFQFLMVRLKALRQYFNWVDKRFQFLMVRLKGKSHRKLVWSLRISIPYGAIKRSEYLIDYLIKRIFQFLMVRLKEQPSRI